MRNFWLLCFILVFTACSGASVLDSPTDSFPTLIEPTSRTQGPPEAPTRLPNQPTALPEAQASPTVPANEQANLTEPPPAPPVEALELPDAGQATWRPIAGGLQRPVFVGNAGDGSQRLFVIEQPGMIRVIQNGVLLDIPFLDIRQRVGSDSNEQGLLGLVFHPQYASNGAFFVNYTDLSGDTIIARFQVNPRDPNLADASSETQLLKIAQPYPNHNGGVLAFGPDGYLYLGLGDGGSAGDPQNNAQSLQSLLGKILRLDVDNGTSYLAPQGNQFTENQLLEIWAYGLRNPWRFAFDRQNGDLYIGDVGQNQWEEINFLAAGQPAGANFGWKYYEGTHVYSPEAPPANLSLIMPVAEYSHAEGCSVTGGVVYRGSQLPAWNGVYLYGDYCSGNVYGLLRDAQSEWQSTLLFENLGRITSFGEDEAGEVYFADHSGQILRLEPKQFAQKAAGLAAATPMRIELPGELASAPDYNITVNVNPDEHTIQGHAQVILTNNETDALDRLYFRLLPNGKGSFGDGALRVNRTLLNDQPVQTKLTNLDTVLEIPLAAALQPGQQATLDFDFEGDVPTDFGEADEGYGIYNYSDGILTLSGWYPLLAVYDQDGWNLDLPSRIGDSTYSDIATYTVEVSVPEGVIVAATGQESETFQNDETTTHRYTSGPARDFFLAMSRDFLVTSQTFNGVTVNSFSLPEHAEAGKQAMQIAGQALGIYGERISPYPYTELDVVEAPIKNALAVEFPGIFLLGSFLYDQPERANFSLSTVHEVAHQWWYNVVGNDVFEDPWLDEGLASFTTLLYYEGNNQPQFAEGMLKSWQNSYQELVNIGQDQPVAQSLAAFENSGTAQAYGPVVYTKGALFFQALRELIGEEAFIRGLKEYYQANQFKIAQPDDLLRAFQDNTDVNLDSLFQQWLYSED